MENNNNRRGIFYGVIGVATLVVTIIGATFAYFSASITGTNNVQAGATTIDLTYGPDITTGLKNDMIPIELDGKGAYNHSTKEYATYTSEQSNTFKSQYANFSPIPGLAATKCKDSNNNSICSVYQFTISNPSTTTAQTIYGSMVVNENTFDNLHYAVFVGAAAEVEANAAKYNVLGDAANATTFVKADKTGLTTGGLIETGKIVPEIGVREDWNHSPILLYSNAATEARMDSVSYTIVLWLEETGVSQEVEEGATFKASVTFDTGTGQGVTGTLGL